MSPLEFLQVDRDIWRCRIADADRRLARAQDDKAKAAAELDAIENDIARLRLAEAAAHLIETGVTA